MPALSRFQTTCRIILALFIATVVVVQTGSVAHADTPWLNDPLQPWNQPGTALPNAPKDEGQPQAICLQQEITAVSAEEKLVDAAGWGMVSFWPEQRSGAVATVIGISNYDGMCRPLSYQAFAFVDGKYAGTLSPVLMNSRTDGALGEVPSITSDRTIEFQFTRYADNDALCCPSRPRALVRYELQNGVFNPVTRTEVMPPTELPNTGGALPAGWPLFLGAALLTVGALLHRQVRPQQARRVA